MPSPFAARFWGGHVVMVVLLLAAILLGIWQIDVYERNRAEAAVNRTHDRSVALTSAIGPDQAFPDDAVGRPVSVSGTWLPQDSVLVSGQEQDGRDGYWVVTPLSVSATGSAMPIVLGWTTDPSHAATPSGTAQLEVWLQPSQADAEDTDADDTDADDTDADDSGSTSGTGSTSGAATIGQTRVDVLPDLQTAELAQEVHQDLYDGYAVARGGVGGLTQAQLPAQPPAGFWTSLRNLLYGVQWWVFGGFAVLMWWRWLGEARAAEATGGMPGDASVGDVDPGADPDIDPGADRGVHADGGPAVEPDPVDHPAVSTVKA